MLRSLMSVLLALSPTLAVAAEVPPGTGLNLTLHWVGFTCVALFIVAYALVVMEEWIHLRKSIPVLIAAALIWILIASVYAQLGDTDTVSATVRHSLLEYAELFLFLLVAMTYINTLEERGVFNALRGWLVSRGFSLRTLFWLTGILAFFISPVADNMTTALVMASVAIAVGRGYPGFVAVACINIVVAANAGGAWSPFGDITTLMVWQKGVLGAHEFLVLFLPSLLSWLIPAVLMVMSVPKATPTPLAERPVVQYGGFLIIFLFIGTIALTVSLHSFLHLPPVLGMMGGLGVLMLVSFILNRSGRGIRHGMLDQGGLGDMLDGELLVGGLGRADADLPRLVRADHAHGAVRRRPGTLPTRSLGHVQREPDIVDPQRLIGERDDPGRGLDGSGLLGEEGRARHCHEKGGQARRQTHA